MYYTLDEAAKILSRAGHPLSREELIRAGAAGILLIAAPLNGTAYSPTFRENRVMAGLYVLAPLDIMKIERDGRSCIAYALSLDGNETFFPHQEVMRDWLRVTVSELDRFAGTLIHRGKVVGESESDSGNQKSHRVYWRRVLNEHIKDIAGKNAMDAIRILKRLGDPRIPNEGSIDLLVWIDDVGERHEVQKKTVQNAISDLIKQPGNPG